MPKRKVTISHVFKTIMWPRRKLLAIGIVLIFISRLSSLVLPYASKILIDDIIPEGNMDLLYKLLGVVVLALVLQAGTSFLLTRLLSVEAQLLISELRAQVQKQILSFPVRFFDNAKSGELVSRIMTDVEGVRNLVGTGLVQLFGGIITSIISLGILIYISP
ncbi:MAG: ABC transporter ATP-binding protein, partial [Flammeovirgaceae bacterium]|nr:ABC transporter ATP-binding protein [Flammeovirgaceae bacterium]